MPNTYTELLKTTVSTTTNTVSFTSIPQTYTDLRLVIAAGETGGGNGGFITFNNDGGTGSLYSFTRMVGDGSSASSARGTNRNTNTWVLGNGIAVPTTPTDVATIDIMNYSNTTTFKTSLARENNAAGGTVANVILWRNTAAINRIDITYSAANFAVGSTFSLYGIAAAVVPTAKATGGTITYGADGYTYHTFTAGGTFTPSSVLSCDALVVAGGGGGGANVGAGGGAGGLRLLASQSFANATAYTVSVGGGGTAGVGGSGAGGAIATAGVNSSIIGGALSIASSGGGFGGGGYTGKTDGGNGGSGGGSTYSQTFSTGNTGGYSPVEGFRGGIVDAALYGRASGGGGASQEGFSASAGGAGAGGAGVNSYNSIDFSIWLSATSKGASGKLAGGGGGGNYNGPTAGLGGAGGGGNGSLTNVVGVAGTVNTGGGGGGGGGDFVNGSAGGSGLVIIRYASA
jgi:hypothetical protein